jgi:hypothetical protein
VVTGSVIGGNAMTVSTISTATLSVNSSTSIYNAGTLTVVNTNAIPAVSAAIIAPNMSLVGASGNLFVLGQATTQYNSMVMGWFSVGAGSTSNYLNINGYGNLTAGTGLNITAGGNVGIGVTNPGYNLQIQGSIQAKNLTHFNWNSNLLGGNFVATPTYWKIASVNQPANGGYGQLSIKGSLGGWVVGSTDQMNVDIVFMSRGALNIEGIIKSASYSNAVAQMDIGYYTNGSSFYDIYLYIKSGIQYISFDLDIGSSGAQSTNNVIIYDPSTVVATTTSPGALTSITAACQMYINGSNVGIGTNSPGGQLSLYSTTSLRDTCIIIKSVQPGIKFDGTLAGGGGKMWNIWEGYAIEGGNAGALITYNETNSVFVFILYPNGNATLGGTLTQNSDITLKKNIEPVANGLSIISNINPVLYHFKTQSDSEYKHYGMIAQDVQKVLPNLVGESNDILTLNYIEFVPILISAVKEQNAIIKSQQAQIDSQKAQIDSLLAWAKTQGFQ